MIEYSVLTMQVQVLTSIPYLVSGLSVPYCEWRQALCSTKCISSYVEITTESLIRKGNTDSYIASSMVYNDSGL